MIETNKQLKYIRSQLAWIKSKVELDNQLGLYDINKLGEDIFMHILNDVYDFNLKNANLIEENFPAIDLIDDAKKIVIQVTSTTTATKLRTTIEKFKKLTQYSDYQLKIFYIKEKPNFNKPIREEFEKEGITSNDILGIDDIINIIQADPQKCETLYKTIQQRMDAISFKFNIESYFEQIEPHLQSITSDKFQQYEEPFMQFIESDNKVLEIHSVGGNGKSHLLRHLGLIEIEYIPLVFTKQINIEEDLKKLDLTKKYLFIVDDIDRFLDQPILLNLLAYTLNNQNIKLILSYRTPSKSAIHAIYRKYTRVNSQELEIIWNEDEIKSLIVKLLPTLEEQKVLKLAHTFNNNPYLITQAIHGDIDSIKDFSKKIIDDTKVALKDFNLSDKEISNLLFNLSLITPIYKNNINKEYQDIITRLVDSKILRELSSKYRFNPDMIGDLYLANYIDENKNTFEKIVEDNLKNFSDTVFTNLSYALIYNENDSLQSFIKRVIQKWIDNKEYKNEYLALVNKVVYFAPMESFIYLQKATQNLTPKETNNFPKSELQEIITTISMDTDTYNSDNDAINIESIEPIVSKFIYALKNNIDCEKLQIEHILKYLTSKEVMSLPKAYYDNQTLESIFSKLVSPLNTRNFDVIVETLAIMEQWLEVDDMDKLFLLQKSITKLLKATFDDTRWEGVSFTMSHIPLNLNHQGVQSVIDASKNILFKMLESEKINILVESLDIIRDIGRDNRDTIDIEYNKFYREIRKNALFKLDEKVQIHSNNLYFLSRVEGLLIDILNFTQEKKEALYVLKSINRTDEYLLYQIVKGVDFLIVNYDKFETQLPKNEEEIKDWMFDNIYSTDGKNSENIEKIIINLSNIMNTEQLIELLNNLATNNWNSKSELMKVLNMWYLYDNSHLNEICTNRLEDISNIITQNILKEFGLVKGIVPLSIDLIDDNSVDDDLRNYLEVIFTDFNIENIDILFKIVDIISKKTPDIIQRYIAIISQKLYFTIESNRELYSLFEPIIIQFLEWQLLYKLEIQSYISHHILPQNNLNISERIKEILSQIVQTENIFIRTSELNPIYKILNYSLQECIDILYNKVTSLKENGNPKYIFTHYFDNDKISEVELLSKFIKTYDDFKFLVNKVLEYYKIPVKFIGADGNEYEAFINLDYFFKYTVKKEYLEELFNELYNDDRIDTIKLLYKIVPVRSDYLEIIVHNLNLLENKVEDRKLIDYLNQVGKMKSWSRSHGENSSLLLNEEALFLEIMNRVDSLSLQLKLKEQLKNIELQKREELEDDISHLLDK